MQGHFDLQMLHTPGLTRELVEAVRKEGGDPAVESYLRQFQRDGRWSADNLVLKTTPGYFYYVAFSNPAMYFGIYGWGGPSMLASIALTSTSAEVNYTSEVYTANLTRNSIPDLVVSGAYKRFIDDCIVAPDIKSDPNGRESIYSKFKWLFLPGEGTSAQIKSITIYYAAQYANQDIGYSMGRVARVRIKDSGSNPVTLNKLSTKSLLIEYTFTIPTI